jgi:hypothetical protein
MLFIVPDEIQGARYFPGLVPNDASIVCHSLAKLVGLPPPGRVAELLTPSHAVGSEADWLVANIVVVVVYAIGCGTTGTDACLEWFKKLTIPAWRVIIPVIQPETCRARRRLLGLAQDITSQTYQTSIITCIDCTTGCSPGLTDVMDGIVAQVKRGRRP